MKEIRILLIGRTGHGKSSVGNTLVGSDAFPVSHGAQSCTGKCNYKDSIRGDIKLVVVDTPGIFDTRIPRLTLMRELVKTVVYTTPGFHVIAFVLRPDRFTNELQQTQQLYFEWFGGNVSNYSCLILTHCSSEDDVRRYTRKPHPALQALMHNCGGSVLPFENTGGFDLKEAQVQRFLEHVIQIQERNGGQCFSNLTYTIAKAYAQNRDLNTITNDSLLLLQNAGIRFRYDSMNSLQMIEAETSTTDNRPGTGNLTIIYDRDSGPTCADSEPRQPSNDIPLLDLAAEIPAPSKNILVEPPAIPQKSSRAGRIFVHSEDDTASPSQASSTSCETIGPTSSPSTSTNFPPGRHPGQGLPSNDFLNTSDAYSNFRDRMCDEENVTNFMKALQWILGKLKALGRGIRNLGRRVGNLFSGEDGTNYDQL